MYVKLLVLDIHYLFFFNGTVLILNFIGPFYTCKIKSNF